MEVKNIKANVLFAKATMPLTFYKKSSKQNKFGGFKGAIVFLKRNPKHKLNLPVLLNRFDFLIYCLISFWVICCPSFWSTSKYIPAAKSCKLRDSV